MVHTLQHDMLARRQSDDLSRQRFVLAFKRYVEGSLRPRNRAVYDRAAEPHYRARNGRPPATRDEAQEALLAEQAYQTFSALKSCSQEMLWQSVSECIHRDEDRLRETARHLRQANTRKGSLELDPNFATPRDMKRADIHGQPRGYVHCKDDEDVLAGALYEMGGNIYSMGRGMGGEDSKAGAAMAYLRKTYPDFAPTLILDIGCSAGASSVPYAQSYPDAEVHAIDVGEAMLRYAHARAEALGYPVHFHLRSADDTKFDDSTFDLVVSHNIMHEISHEVRRGMLRETFRILKPGGIAIHQDVMIRYQGWDIFEQAERSWDLRFNTGPFWDLYGDGEILKDARAAGFAPGSVNEIDLQKISGPGAWYALVARKGAPVD